VICQEVMEAAALRAVVDLFMITMTETHKDKNKIFIMMSFIDNNIN